MRRRTYKVFVALDLLGAQPPVRRGDHVGPMKVMACWGRGVTWRMEFSGEVSTRRGVQGAIRKTALHLREYIQSGCELVIHPEEV